MASKTNIYHGLSTQGAIYRRSNRRRNTSLAFTHRWVSQIDKDNCPIPTVELNWHGEHRKVQFVIRGVQDRRRYSGERLAALSKNLADQLLNSEELNFSTELFYFADLRAFHMATGQHICSRAQNDRHLYVMIAAMAQLPPLPDHELLSLVTSDYIRLQGEAQVTLPINFYCFDREKLHARLRFIHFFATAHAEQRMDETRMNECMLDCFTYTRVRDSVQIRTLINSYCDFTDWAPRSNYWQTLTWQQWNLLIFIDKCRELWKPDTIAPLAEELRLGSPVESIHRYASVPEQVTLAIAGHTDHRFTRLPQKPSGLWGKQARRGGQDFPLAALAEYWLLRRYVRQVGVERAFAVYAELLNPVYSYEFAHSYLAQASAETVAPLLAHTFDPRCLATEFVPSSAS